MKPIINWFTNNHVAANLLMMLLMFAGAVTAVTMKLEVFPETSPDRIAITVEYPGASPDEVEEAIIRRVEEKVAGLAGIKRIDSTAREGFAMTTIEVLEGWDLKKLLDEVKSEVDRITTFPDEAEQPVVREITRTTEVISVAVYGDVPEQTIKRLSENIKDDITNLPDITYAEIFGVRTTSRFLKKPCGATTSLWAGWRNWSGKPAWTYLPGPLKPPGVKSLSVPRADAIMRRGTET